jgi:4-hydroxy-tetrahydrodipicolinate synthase
MDPGPPPFTGIGVALVTLFDDSGAVDEKATADLAARLVDDGVRAVVVAGSTGEAAALEEDERRRLLQAVRSRLDGVPVLAGTGGDWGGQAARRTAAAREGGADAALVLSPRAVADPRPYYAQVAAAAGDLPLLAYHLPAVAPPGVPVEVLPDLPVVGAKDSSGDPQRMLQTLSTWSGHLYPGSSALLSFAGPLGCPGAILALANAEPARCAAAFAGDPEAQLALTSAHLTAAAAVPAGIKGLVAARYGTSTVRRMG